MARSKVGTLSVWLTAQDRGFGRGMRNARTQMTTTQRAAQRLSTGIRSVGSSMAGLAGVSFGIYGIARGVQNATGAFAKQELAVATLRAALIKTGKDGTESLDMITESAARLQRQTMAADEELIKATATLAQLAPSLNADELTRAQTAIIGLANTFTEGKVENAAVAIGKSLGGTVDLLARWGVGVGTAGDATERLGRLLPKTAKFFEVAKAATNTLTGRTTQLKNAYGDLLEQIGRVIIVSTDFQGQSETMAERLYRVTDAIESNIGSILTWTRTALVGVKLVAQAVLAIPRAFFEFGRALGSAFGAIGANAVAAIQLAANDAIRILNGLLEQIDKVPGVDIEFRLKYNDVNGALEVANLYAANIDTAVDNLADAFAAPVRSAGEFAAWLDLANDGFEIAINGSSALAASTSEAADNAGRLADNAANIRFPTIMGPAQDTVGRQVGEVRGELVPELPDMGEALEASERAARFLDAYYASIEQGWSNKPVDDAIANGAKESSKFAQQTAQTIGTSIINGLVYGIKSAEDFLKAILSSILSSALSALLNSAFGPGGGILGGLLGSVQTRIDFAPATLSVTPELQAFTTPTFDDVAFSVTPELQAFTAPTFDDTTFSVTPQIQAFTAPTFDDTTFSVTPQIQAFTAPTFDDTTFSVAPQIQAFTVPTFDDTTFSVTPQIRAFTTPTFDDVAFSVTPELQAFTTPTFDDVAFSVTPQLQSFTVPTFDDVSFSVTPELQAFTVPTFDDVSFGVFPEIQPFTVPALDPMSVDIMPQFRPATFAPELGPNVLDMSASQSYELSSNGVVDVEPPQIEVVVNTYPSLFENPGEAARDPQAQVFIRDAMSRARYQGYR